MSLYYSGERIMVKKIALSSFLLSALVACGGGGGGSADGNGGGDQKGNTPPEATGLSITTNQGASVEPGTTVTGGYQYTDAEDDAEGATGFRWLIDGAAVGSEQSYTVQASDVGKSITFEVSPIASTGALSGETVTSTAVSINPLNNPPVASAISITDSNGGSAWAGDELLGHYTYSDAEDDAQGGTSLRWLVDGLEVATGNRFLTTKAEAGKSVVFEVTPVASQGTITGQKKSSQPFSMKRDLHYIKANTLEQNNNLFVTDGTEAGTLNLELTTLGTVSQPVKFGDKWIFAVFDTDSSKVRLAETDGSLEGTKIFTCYVRDVSRHRLQTTCHSR